MLSGEAHPPRTRRQRVAIIGVGLMGGSLGLAARERAGAAEVRGFSQTQATLDAGAAARRHHRGLRQP